MWNGDLFGGCIGNVSVTQFTQVKIEHGVFNSILDFSVYIELVLKI